MARAFKLQKLSKRSFDFIRPDPGRKRKSAGPRPHFAAFLGPAAIAVIRSVRSGTACPNSLTGLYSVASKSLRGGSGYANWRLRRRRMRVFRIGGKHRRAAAVEASVQRFPVHGDAAAGRFMLPRPIGEELQ